MKTNLIGRVLGYVALCPRQTECANYNEECDFVAGTDCKDYIKKPDLANVSLSTDDRAGMRERVTKDSRSDAFQQESMQREQGEATWH